MASKNFALLLRETLNGLSKHDNSANQTVNLLTEYLENKNDPGSNEIVLIDAIYQYIEKKNLLESHLRNYLKEQKDKSFHTNKLEQIYDSQDNTKDWDL